MTLRIFIKVSFKSFLRTKARAGARGLRQIARELELEPIGLSQIARELELEAKGLSLIKELKLEPEPEGLVR